MLHTLSRTFVLALVVSAGAACVDDPLDRDPPDLGTEAAALGGGTPAPYGHPAVGWVPGCTATLIADNLVLTAAHCLCPASPPGAACTADAKFTMDRVQRRDDPATPADESQQWIQVEFNGNQVAVHPDYKLGVRNDANDLAVVRLAAPASSMPITVTPLALAPAIPPSGTFSTLIGSGTFDTAGFCDDFDGIKRMGYAPLHSIINQGTGGTIVNIVDPVVHLCPGDSGGPLLDNYNRVYGVASWSDFATTSEYEATFPSLEWIGLQRLSPGNRVATWDLALAAGYGAQGLYDDTDPDQAGLLQWNDADDLHLVGNFANTGYDQVMQIDNTAFIGRVRVADYGDGLPPTEVRFLANDGSTTATRLAGWTDSNDAQLVGDFMNLGHDQVLFLNRSGSGGRARILDFSNPAVAAQILYDEPYGASTILNGWMDSNDKLVAGDFLSIGYDQVMLLNNSGTGGRLEIVDFSDGTVPTERWRLYNYGDPVVDPLIGGWHDSADVVIAGDFMGVGREQVALLNQNFGAGRLQVLDFGPGTPVRRYYETYGQSTLLDGYHTVGDLQFAGDFRGTGRDQLLFVDNQNGGGLLVADLSDGAAPVAVAYTQRATETVAYFGRLDADDRKLVGNLRSNTRAVLTTLERW